MSTPVRETLKILEFGPLYETRIIWVNGKESIHFNTSPDFTQEHVSSGMRRVEVFECRTVTWQIGDFPAVISQTEWRSLHVTYIGGELMNKTQLLEAGLEHLERDPSMFFARKAVVYSNDSYYRFDEEHRHLQPSSRPSGKYHMPQD